MREEDDRSESQSEDDFSILLRSLSQLQDVHLAGGRGTTSIPALPTIVAIGNQSDGKSSTIGTHFSLILIFILRFLGGFLQMKAKIKMYLFFLSKHRL